MTTASIWVPDELQEAWRVQVDAARAALAPAIVTRVEQYTPYFRDRTLTRSQFDDAAPHLRDVALLAMPASVDLAADYLSWSVGLLEHLIARRLPRKAHLLWRDTTIETYLATRTAGSQSSGRSILGKLRDAALAGLAGEAFDAAARAERTVAHRQQRLAETQQAQRDGERTDSPLLVDATVVRRADADERAMLGLRGEHADDLLAALAALRVMVAQVRPDALAPQVGKMGRGRAIPVGDLEVVQLLRAASTHRSAKTRRHAVAAALVGLGTGLAGEALAGVRGTDIDEHTVAGSGIVTVAVTHRGERVLVPVLPPLAPSVLQIGQQTGGGFVIGGSTARVNRLSALAKTLRDADRRSVGFDSFRLRATWMALHVMAGSYLPTVLTCAGVDGLTGLDELLPYCPPLPTPAAGKLFAALRTQMLTAAVLTAEAQVTP